jgi:hypothetical protein
MTNRQGTGSQAQEEPALELAHRNFGPIGSFLEQLGTHVSDHKPSFNLVRREDMHRIAQHTFETRYSLCNGSTDRLSLTFTVVGRDADVILFQRHKRSSPCDIRADPGEADLNVYKLDEVDRLKQVLQDKVISYLSA